MTTWGSEKVSDKRADGRAGTETLTDCRPPARYCPVPHTLGTLGDHGSPPPPFVSQKAKPPKNDHRSVVHFSA